MGALRLQMHNSCCEFSSTTRGLKTRSLIIAGGEIKVMGLHTGVHIIEMDNLKPTI